MSLGAAEVSACRALLLDVDGCLVLSDRPGGEGGQALPGAAGLLDLLRETGRRYVLFTNASSLPPSDLASSLRALGLAVDGAQVVTPPVVAADYLAERHASRPVLAFGGPGVVEPLRARGVELLALEEHERAAAVLVGGDPEFGHRKLEAAARAVTRGAELLVTSNSRWFAGRGGRQVGVAAAIAAGITYVTGVEAQVVGKPSPLALREVLRRLDVEARELLVVGDDPDLEIRMGKGAGCPTVLVLTGMADGHVTDHLPPELRPDLVLDGIWDLPALLAL